MDIFVLIIKFLFYIVPVLFPILMVLVIIAVVRFIVTLLRKRSIAYLVDIKPYLPIIKISVLPVILVYSLCSNFMFRYDNVFGYFAPWLPGLEGLVPYSWGFAMAIIDAVIISFFLTKRGFSILNTALVEEGESDKPARKWVGYLLVFLGMAFSLFAILAYVATSPALRVLRMLGPVK